MFDWIFSSNFEPFVNHYMYLPIMRPTGAGGLTRKGIALFSIVLIFHSKVHPHVADKIQTWISCYQPCSIVTCLSLIAELNFHWNVELEHRGKNQIWAFVEIQITERTTSMTMAEAHCWSLVNVYVTGRWDLTGLSSINLISWTSVKQEFNSFTSSELLW